MYSLYVQMIDGPQVTCPSEGQHDYLLEEELEQVYSAHPEPITGDVYEVFSTHEHGCRVCCLCVHV